MTTIKILPDNDHTNGWNAGLAPREPTAPLSGDIQVDFVVVGAGLAGLAAARRLAENCPDKTVALVEARKVGDGAHARNSGFAIDVPHNTRSSMSELSESRRHLNLARSAIDYLEKQVKKYNIQCEWTRSGKFHAAVSQAGIDHILRPTVEALESLNEHFEWFEGKAFHDKVGFRHFAAAIYTPGTVLLNPAALTRGLADNLPSNVTLYENTPVTRVRHEPEVVLDTPKGVIRAGTMILAVNVFAEQFGFYKNRLIPMAAHASLSRRLTASEQQRLAGLKSWGITPANAFVGITMRRTNDQRILIRQHMEYAPDLRRSDASRARVKQEHQALFDERFPMLKGVSMEYTWTGIMCVSANSHQGFGKVAPHVYSAVCQNGVGLTKGTIGGVLAADLASQVENPLIEELLAVSQPKRLPPRPLLDIGVQARFKWELWHARAEA